MAGKKPGGVWWPTNKDDSDHMKMRQMQNRARSARNPNEQWMAEKLKATGKKWTSNASWGFRLFDFWCHELGVAVEVDGPEHDAKKDAHHDAWHMKRSGILVLRVRNGNEDDADRALKAIASAETWRERRDKVDWKGRHSRGQMDLGLGQENHDGN